MKFYFFNIYAFKNAYIINVDLIIELTWNLQWKLMSLPKTQRAALN